MKIYSLLIALAISSLTFGAKSETVDLTIPGSLANKLAGNTSVSSLTIKGPMNAADFDFIQRKLTNLITLDLSGASIQVYNGAPVLSGSTSYAANSLPDYALAGVKLKNLSLPASITSIGAGALAAVPVESVNIPVSVRSIGKGAFSNAGLRAITVPATVLEIDSLAFANCTSLAYVTYGCPEIPPAAFKGCYRLSKFTAQTPVSTIGDFAFSGCTALTDFNFSESLKSIGAGAFRGSGLRSVNLQNSSSLNSIGAWAFSDCTALTEAILPESLTNVGEGAFFGDSSLSSITLPKSLINVADYMFTGSGELNPSNVIGENTVSIGKYAYTNISSPQAIKLPSSLDYIGDNAMEGWENLQTIDASSLAHVPSLGTEVWKNVDQYLVKLVVDPTMTDAFLAAPQWQEFIIEKVSGIDDIPGESIDADAAEGINAWFEGQNLVITSIVPVDVVRLAGVGGVNLTNRSGNSANKVSIDTSRWTDKVYIVIIELTNGKKAALKLAR